LDIIAIGHNHDDRIIPAL